MSQTKHTPGKWQREGMTVYALNEGGVNRFLMQVQGGFSTWEARRHYGARTDMDELEANAILVSAAPDLLAALKSIAAIEDKYEGTDWQEIEEAREIARAAIAKAEGTTP